MKVYSWNEEKNRRLKAERGVSFEEIVFYIERGHLLDVVEHPNQGRYRGQRVFIVNVNDYACLVPFVETESEFFLKTIIPSRKATKKHLRGSENGQD
jgi:uncharacterized DUF497 family protein